MRSHEAEININKDLNQLKHFFEHLEGYATEQNVGLRSLKNLGVWLLAYALTDKKDQQAILESVTTKNDRKTAATLIASLSQPKNLKKIIQDYETANGKFEFKIPANLIKGIYAKAQEVGVLDLVQNHCVSHDDPESFAFNMQNEIDFKWAAREFDFKTFQPYNTALKLTQTKAKFQAEESIPFYIAGNKTASYALVVFNQQMYHVARLHTVQINDAKQEQSTAAYLVQSLDEKAQASVQLNYLDIIRRFPAEDKHDAHLNSLLEQHLQKPIPGLEINEEMSRREKEVAKAKNVRVVNKFDTTILFPALAERLKTVEQRLGIYASFVGKIVGTYPIKKVLYKGERELTYDSVGGKIKNKEEVRMCLESMCILPQYNHVKIRYSFDNPFMLIYEAPQNSDYYPFQISNPRRDLKLSFNGGERYGVFAQLKVSADQGAVSSTLAKGVESIKKLFSLG